MLECGIFERRQELSRSGLMSVLEKSDELCPSDTTTQRDMQLAMVEKQERAGMKAKVQDFYKILVDKTT